MMLLLTFALAATPPEARSGPSKAELAAAFDAAPEVMAPASMRADTIHSVRCRAFEEEPTEYRCRFKASDADGRLRRRSAIVALGKDGWVLLSLK